MAERAIEWRTLSERRDKCGEDNKEWKWNLTNKMKLRTIKKANRRKHNYRMSGNFCFFFLSPLFAGCEVRGLGNLFGDFFSVLSKLLVLQIPAMIKAL